MCGRDWSSDVCSSDRSLPPSVVSCSHALPLPRFPPLSLPPSVVSFSPSLLLSCQFLSFSVISLSSSLPLPLFPSLSPSLSLASLPACLSLPLYLDIADGSCVPINLYCSENVYVGLTTVNRGSWAVQWNTASYRCHSSFILRTLRAQSTITQVHQRYSVTSVFQKRM